MCVCIYIYIYIYIYISEGAVERINEQLHNCTTHRSQVPLRRSGRMLCPRIKSLRVLLIYNWGCFNLNAHLFDISYFVQYIIMIITISVFAISKGNPPFTTPNTLQCVLQSKTLVLLAARKTKLLLKFWMDYIAKKARKERSLNNH